MKTLLVTISILLLLLISFSRQEQIKPGKDSLLHLYHTADSLYQAAESLVNSRYYSEKEEEEFNRRSLGGFNHLIPLLSSSYGNDSLAFHCYFKKAVLEHYFENTEVAKQFYQKAIAAKKQTTLLADSFLFKPWLYQGLIYYTDNQPDSATICFRNAEKISTNYSIPLTESERLYNNLGIYYHETGNFSQARNYFEKAIAVLSPSNLYYPSLLINYNSNLASSLIRLERYDEAEAIYNSSLSFDQYKNEMLFNRGIIKLNKGQYDEAIRFFKQTNYETGKNVRTLAYTGLSFFHLKNYDSARLYFVKAASDNLFNKNQNNTANGIALKFTADLLSTEKKYEQAIATYQQAILQFYPGFTASDNYTNPSGFSGVFSFINLFHALIAKADALENWYKNQNNTEQLKASLAAYYAAFSLADYVEKTYDSDEARLFLNKIKYSAHSKPINICLQLYEITRQKKFLEDAWLFDQRNKASILSLNAEVNLQRHIHKNPLFEKETSLRSAITRLSLNAAQLTDTAKLKEINGSIRDYEMQLGKVQDKLNEDATYKAERFAEHIPSVKEVQKKLDAKTALLSYHLSENNIVCILITGNQLKYVALPVDTSFFSLVDSFKQSLHSITTDTKYNGANLATGLYKKLISPLLRNLTGMERLIIIPDDELNNLPFEALQNENKHYLIEDFAVHYQYSAALLDNANEVTTNSNLLAFAPFAAASFKENDSILLSSLPASQEEVASLKGTIFIDSMATKNNFLRLANQYSILHLATHASVNNQQPLRSYISFYPGNADYKLYAQEIYDLDLDSTQLVILSACETGTGQLIKGEGLMSLSRAFAYAGCSNIITSLWKAEDKTTAYITQRLHHHLNKGNTYDQALQKAKLDLLHSADIDPRYKSPNYWAHLLFIGNYEAASNTIHWWWISGIIGIAGLLFILYKKTKIKHVVSA